jgi:hypothetical protein
MNWMNRRAGGRRAFLRSGVATASAALLSGILGGARPASADEVTPGDVAVLKFLAAAELVEDDLWQQYTELAIDNADFRNALRRIDPSLPRYVNDDRDDERSHAMLINAFLQSIGETPINLDPFRTLPSVNVRGAQQVGRLTNLTALTVDTSWYLRYRGTGNPDFGDSFPQLVEIQNRPTVPTSNKLNNREAQTIAHSAAFHFAAIEQGGSSLYNSLLTKVTSLDVVAILASIGPTEVYHFAAFHKSLEGLFGLKGTDGLNFPNLAGMPLTSQAIFPEPCKFLDVSLPLCSVIRPRNTANAGAVAAATGLVQSGLFAGQSQAFFDAVVALATAADAAQRTLS